VYGAVVMAMLLQWFLCFILWSRQL